MASGVASPEHMKEIYADLKTEGARMVDHVDRTNVRNIALLALTADDVENLKMLSEADGRVRNYAVLIRRLIAREAKALRTPQLPFDLTP